MAEWKVEFIINNIEFTYDKIGINSINKNKSVNTHKTQRETHTNWATILVGAL